MRCGREMASFRKYFFCWCHVVAPRAGGGGCGVWAVGEALSVGQDLPHGYTLCGGRTSRVIGARGMENERGNAEERVEASRRKGRGDEGAKREGEGDDRPRGEKQNAHIGLALLTEQWRTKVPYESRVIDCRIWSIPSG